MTQAMTTMARRAPAGAERQFPLWCKGGKHRRRVPRKRPKVSLFVQQDQDRQDGKTEVIIEPTLASRSGALQVKTTFRQDKMYCMFPFKIGRCGIPSRLSFGGK
jgi:hypothetical protein